MIDDIFCKGISRKRLMNRAVSQRKRESYGNLFSQHASGWDTHGFQNMQALFTVAHDCIGAESPGGCKR